MEDEGDTADNSWDKDAEGGNEVNPADGLQDLQYFPNFYRLLRSLDSGKKQKNRSLAGRNLVTTSPVVFPVQLQLANALSDASIHPLPVTACAATRAAGMLEPVPAVVLHLGHVPARCSTCSVNSTVHLMKKKISSVLRLSCCSFENYITVVLYFF